MKSATDAARSGSLPKRPLSAYNLFYRYKRSKILDAASVIASGDSATDTKEQSIARIIEAIVGLEDYPTIDSPSNFGDEAVQYLRRNEIQTVLRKNLSPNEGSNRSHRKSPPGDISLVDMNKLMCKAWKNIDEFGKSVIDELAEEGKKLYLDKVKAFEAREETDKKSAAPPSSRKAKKKKKNAKVAKTSADDEPERPKNPLTAYNLFYRYKRAKILEAHGSGVDSKEATRDLIMAAAGLEGDSLAVPFSNETRQAEIHSRLKDNLCPKPDTTRRSHRKSHVLTLSFMEMGKFMCASWKGLDAFGRRVFEDLADEGRRIYREKVKEYEEKKNAAKSPTSAAKKGTETESLKKRALVESKEALFSALEESFAKTKPRKRLKLDVKLKPKLEVRASNSFQRTAAARVESTKAEKSASSPRKRLKPKLEVHASNFLLHDEAATLASTKYESPSRNNDRMECQEELDAKLKSSFLRTDMAPSPFESPVRNYDWMKFDASVVTPETSKPTMAINFFSPFDMHLSARYPAAPTNGFVPPTPFPVVSPTADAATLATTPFYPDPGMPVFPDIFADKQCGNSFDMHLSAGQQYSHLAAQTNGFVPPPPFSVASPTADAATLATVPFYPDPGIPVFPEIFEDEQRGSDDCSDASFDVMSLMESCSEEGLALDATFEDYMRRGSDLD